MPEVILTFIRLNDSQSCSGFCFNLKALVALFFGHLTTPFSRSTQFRGTVPSVSLPSSSQIALANMT